MPDTPRHPTAPARRRPLQRTAALATIALCISAAHARSGIEIGPQLTEARLALDGAPTAKPSVLGIRVGVRTSNAWAFEARLGTSLSDDAIGGSGVDVEVDSLQGLYARALLPLTPAVTAYGLVGYTRMKLRFESGGASGTQTDSDATLGVGLDWRFSGQTSLGVEWARLQEGPGNRFDGLSASLLFRF